MEFVDTHCHLQFEKYDDPARVVDRAKAAGVSRMICVGTTIADSQKAMDIAARFDGVWSSVGSHPHEASAFLADPNAITIFKKMINKPAPSKTLKRGEGEYPYSEHQDFAAGSSIVAIGEIGLDYYKNYSPRQDQKKALRMQIEAGLGSGLPFIFHVRDGWEDFWQIFDSYPSLRGVVHSFSATEAELEQILQRDLYVGLNGIMTFTSDERQLEAAQKVPLQKLFLETDAPFLTPKPHRGQVCEPKHVVDVARFLADLRGETLEELAQATTTNATGLFNLEAKDG